MEERKHGPQTAPVEERKPRKYQSLTIEFKRNVIKAIQDNPFKKKCDIAKEFGVPATTLISILKNKEKYFQASCMANTCKRVKPCLFGEVETLVLEWMAECKQGKVRVGGRQLRNKAQEVALHLGYTNFRASNGWIHNFKKRHGISFGCESNVEPKTYEASGSSERLGSDSQDKRKTHKDKQAKRIRMDNETASDCEDDGDPENCLQEPFEMIEIEEPRIKEEIFETEEFDGSISEDDTPVQSNQKNLIETISVTPDIVKMENSDDEDFSPAFIKEEPLDVLENEEEEDREQEKDMTMAQDKPLQMWRCPLVSCPERFDSRLQMYEHINVNHVVEDLALSSRSQPSTPALSVVMPGVTGLVSYPPTTCTTTVTPGLPVPSSSCGPVTVTTTFSYSPLTTTTSLITSVSCSELISSASPTVAYPSPTSSPVLPSITAVPAPPLSIDTPSRNTSTSSSNHTPTDASHGQKIIVAPISNTNGSSGSKKFLLLTPRPSPGKNPSRPSKSQSIKIFHPTEQNTDHLYQYQCARDESENFFISLAKFPQDKRVSIKQKLLEVISCIIEKSVSPEKLLIAYYDNVCDSRTM